MKETLKVVQKLESEGIPVQFIPAYNALIEEAVKEADQKEYDGLPVKVLKMEHLFAIMAQTKRPKDRERIKNLFGNIQIDHQLLESILKRHELKQTWEKIVDKE